MGSIPGPGTCGSHRHGQKEKKKRKAAFFIFFKENTILSLGGGAAVTHPPAAFLSYKGSLDPPVRGLHPPPPTPWRDRAGGRGSQGATGGATVTLERWGREQPSLPLRSGVPTSTPKAGLGAGDQRSKKRELRADVAWPGLWLNEGGSSRIPPWQKFSLLWHSGNSFTGCLGPAASFLSSTSAPVPPRRGWPPASLNLRPGGRVYPRGKA